MPVTAFPAAVSPQAPYYFVWEYRWCGIGGGPYDCPSEWYPYDEGLNMTTIYPWISASDRLVNIRVRQYTQDRRTLVGNAWHQIGGAGECPDGSGYCDIARAAPPNAPPDSTAPATGTPVVGAPAADVNARRTWGARGQPRRPHNPKVGTQEAP